MEPSAQHVKLLISLVVATVLAIGATTLLVGAAFGQAEAPPVSKCLAIADAGPQLENPGAPKIVFAKAEPSEFPFLRANAVSGQVTLTYLDHAVWQIMSPEGVSAVTDYYGLPVTPTPQIATMNNAHRTHWTPTPDPAIKHVLQGWSQDGVTPQDHHIVEGDIYVRNVPTDIRWGGSMTPNGNSIFIFEVADLCIGHLGHLHHPLEDAHYARIGRLDVVMVPVDGGLTLSHDGMSELVKRLQPSVLLPMHLRGNSVQSFISMLGEGFASEYLTGDSVQISVRDLPRVPTVFVPQSLN
jgi:L-ascorbate metabolism protein UlaG (beta-lactamase superfamily)